MDFVPLVLRALLIFSLRMLDISLYTTRVLMVVRGRRKAAWLAAFLQSVTYVNSLRLIVLDAHNWYFVAAYAAGFATGLLVGMWIESRLSLGITHLRIVSRSHGMEIAECLRARRYAVTEVPAYGLSGGVTLLLCDVLRKHTQDVVEVVCALDEQAFVTAENVRLVWRGYWGEKHNNRTVLSRQSG